MSADPKEGDIFAGKYRVEKVLGHGGMGTVLGAHHLGLDEPVAIKILLPAMLEIPGMVDRFLREARAAAKIKNEHVARVTDVDSLPSGVPYIVMERLDGLDLAALYKQKKRLEVEEAVRYTLEACEAIAEAHEIGIIHRDLKPANIFLAKRRDGSSVIKVLDFGISKLTGVLAQHQATTIGTVLGSPSYMSPEQMASAQDVDGRTDIWALGAILYQLTTGELPFRGDTLPQICTKVIQAAPRPPREIRPELSAEFEALILRCLEKDKTARFATVGELMAALRPLSGLGQASIRSAAPVPDLVGAPSLPSASSPGTIIVAPTQRLNESIVSSAVTLLRPQVTEPKRSRHAAILAGGGAVVIAIAGVIASVQDGRERGPSAVVTSASPAMITTTATATTTEVVQAAPSATTRPPAPAPIPAAPSVAASASVAPSATALETPKRSPAVKAPVKPIKPTPPADDDPFRGNQK